MPKFNGGVYVFRSRKEGDSTPYLKISAGPLRNQYVHTIVAEAMIGRKLEKDETVEHKDGNGLNPSPSNLKVVTRKVNTRLRHLREQRERKREAGEMALSQDWLESRDEEAPF